MHRNLAGQCRSERGSRRARALGLGVLGACWLAFLPSGSDLYAANRLQPEAGGPRQEAPVPQQEDGAAHTTMMPLRRASSSRALLCGVPQTSASYKAAAGRPRPSRLNSARSRTDPGTRSICRTWAAPPRPGSGWPASSVRGAMPPAGRPRPDAEMRDAFLARLEADLDAAWAERFRAPADGRLPSTQPRRVTPTSSGICWLSTST